MAINWNVNSLTFGSIVSANTGNHVYGGIPQFTKTTGVLPAQVPVLPRAALPNTQGQNGKASLNSYPSIFKYLSPKK